MPDRSPHRPALLRTPRRFPHDPAPETFDALEERYLQDLVNFRTVHNHALAHDQVSLIGDFAPLALGL
ncbi:MAG: hypothetical protein GXP62_02430, partial [Oligoflexia bacterium]|nr:hypothetical protein [Oligoflexia bacterium]